MRQTKRTRTMRLKRNGPFRRIAESTVERYDWKYAQSIAIATLYTGKLAGFRKTILAVPCNRPLSLMSEVGQHVPVVLS